MKSNCFHLQCRVQGAIYLHIFSLETSLRVSAINGLKPEHMEEDNNSVNKWEPNKIPWIFMSGKNG